MTDNHRITDIALHAALMESLPPAIMQDCGIALQDILAANTLQTKSGLIGPYRVDVHIRDERLTLLITGYDGVHFTTASLGLSGLRKLIRDYMKLRDNHEQSFAQGVAHRIEALDMGRRGLHDEGARHIMEALSDSVVLDIETARKFFTLLVLLHRRMGNMP